MIHLRLDFETRSRADISLGGFEYALDPSTRVLCLAFKVGGGPVQTFRYDPESDRAQPMPPGLSEVLAMAELLGESPGVTVHAFNVAFEQVIWRHVLGWPEPAAWSCTMALCAVNALPQSLDGASQHLGFGGKHDAGYKVMKKACSPNKKSGEFATLTEAEWADLIAYCAQDVDLEDRISEHLGPFPELERPVWEICNAINQRGVAIDRDLCTAAVRLVERLGETCNDAVVAATNGAVKGEDLTRVAWLLEWINAQGVELDELTAGSIAGALRRKALPDHVRAVLEARRRISRASVKKMQAMLDGTTYDGRLRGQFRYCGAVTGRWKSRGEENFYGREGSGVQLQNLPRGSLKQDATREAVAATLANDLPRLAVAGGGEADSALVAIVRPAVVAAPGKLLALVDWAAIEARGALWLAGDAKHLKWFSDFDAGKDVAPYCKAASQTFGRPITSKKDDPLAYQCGKVQMLMLQYGAGGDKTDATCALQGIDLASAGLTGQGLVDAYRKEFTSLAGHKDPATGRFICPGYWKQLERGALDAFKHGERIEVGPITFGPGKFGDLAMRLPSGRVIRYHKPTIVVGRFGSDQLAYTDLREKRTAEMYGGKWLENATQAICRDILADAMVRVTAHGFKIVMTVHDEIVCEVDEATADADLKCLAYLMRQAPGWAKGFPLNVEGLVTSRYGKESF